MSTTILPTPPVEGEAVRMDPPRRRRRLRYRRNRLAYGLIAPAVALMLVVHLLPMVGGLTLSFKDLNTFTFAQLFGAPWTGVDNYDAILFDSGNPLRSGFLGAVQNTAVYTLFTVTGTLGGGLAVAMLLNREMRGQKIARTLMLTPWIVPSFVVAVLGSSCGRATSA